MKLDEFKVLAKAMGATFVFNHSANALFQGPKYNIILELNDEQLAAAKPVELAYIMADYAMMN